MHQVFISKRKERKRKEKNKRGQECCLVVEHLPSAYYKCLLFKLHCCYFYYNTLLYEIQSNVNSGLRDNGW